MTVTVSISEQSINNFPTLYVLRGSVSVHDVLDQRSTCTFAVYDKTGTHHYQPGQPVIITDTFAITSFNPTGITFTGYINDSSELELVPNADIVSTISCIDQHYLADKRVSQTEYTGWFAGDIVCDFMARYLSQEGVQALYALRRDSTVSDFTQGTLNNVRGALNVGDGDLELAPAGSTVSIVENTTATFSAGSLTSVTASSNHLALTATPTIQFTGTQSLAGVSNAYTYRKIWAGSVAIAANDTFSYDVWISTNSPEFRAGIELTCSDGTGLRDFATIVDGQGIPPHPGNDLTGLANGQWYHRSFTMSGPLVGKTLASAAVAQDGDKVGAYTAYFKNIIFTHSGTPTNIFSTSLNVNPTVQILNVGYSNVSVNVVNTYANGNRVSSAYNIGAATLVKQSFVTWNAVLPTGTNFLLETSLDGGATYQTCTHYQAVPNLLAGMRVGPSRTLTVRETLSITGSDPNVTPTLTMMSITVVPAAQSTTTDVINTTANFSGGTLTNLVGGANSLKLTGVQRNWDNGDYSSQSIFGPGTVSHIAVQGQMTVTTSGNGVSRPCWDQFTFAGNFQNFTAEIDFQVVNDLDGYGLVYRSQHLSNNSGSYAYACRISNSSIDFLKGQNNSAGGSVTQITSFAFPTQTGVSHRLKIIVTGTTHNFYVDEVLYLTHSDSTFNVSGNLGLYYENTQAGTQTATFDNFGVTSLTGTLSGTWVSPSVSLNTVIAVGNSIIMWNATVPDTTSLKVEASIDGGSTYFPCTNGAIIPVVGHATPVTNKSLKIRVTLTSTNTTVVAQMTGLTWWVTGEYFATGSRTGLPLNLSNVGKAGATLVSWNAVVPTGTTLSIDTSLDGTTWATIGGGAQGSSPIAGITSQLDPIEDSFQKQSASLYTATSQSGGQNASWTWDTTNSRILAVGGSNAFLLYSSLIAQDVELTADVDEADACGLVWRQVDNKNFYAISVQDARSVSPNQIILNKVTGGVRTQLASVSITFARGTPHRVRVTMIGGVITVFFDGIVMISYTDLHPLGAGLTGLCNDSIVASGTGRFYRFRVQPQGDSVVGMNAFTRVRFTSTDPTLTPQLLDITTSVHNPSIQNGAFIPSTAYSVLNGSTNTIAADLDDLAKQSNYWWRIFHFVLSFQARNAILSPWIVTGDDIKRGLGAVQVDTISDLFRTSSWVLGGTDTQLVSQTFIGDGITQSWNMDYPVESLQAVTVDGNAVSFGVQGVDTGKQIYYTGGNNTITQDITQSPYLAGQSLFFSYNARENVAVNASDFAQIAARAAIDKTSGLIEVAETASGLSRDAAIQLAQSRIIQYGVDGQDLQFPVIRSGLGVGQLASVFLPSHAITDGEYLITDISTKYMTVNKNGMAIDQPVYTLSMTSGPVIASWMTYQASLHK